MSKELAEYLKTKPGLDRLFNELKKKYISLGRYSGSVKIYDVTVNESIDIGDLLGRKVDVGSLLKTSFSEITKKIEQGKFKNFNWEELFKYYFGNNIVCKKDKKLDEEYFEIKFFDEFIKQNNASKYIKYIDDIIKSKNEIYKIIRKKYRTDKAELNKNLLNILNLLDNIPDVPTSLPIYSSIIGNPHYLDFNSSESNLFFRILSFINNVDYPFRTQDKVNLLSSINVYIDPFSNFVITYNLKGNKILDELSEKNQVLNLNLVNIEEIGKLDTDLKKVFVFENPSLLYSLMDFNVPIVITSGMPNLAVYKVLDKLKMSGNILYYNGDFDPEGLLIADKLKMRYSDLELFCYDNSDYEMAKSMESIGVNRLKKLDAISTKELGVMKNILLNNKLAAYQEKNIDRIKDYIKNIIH